MEKFLLKLAWHLKSDHLSVLACICISIAQSLHTYYIVVYSSRLENIFLIQFQAIILSIILSLGLLVNIFKSGSEIDEDLKTSYKRKVKTFAFIEVFINLHYWGKEMLYTPYMTDKPLQIYDFIAAFVLSIAIPWILYSYAGNIMIPMFSELNNGKKILLTITGTKKVDGKTKYEVLPEEI